MSNFSGFSRRAPLQSSVPRGDVLASFSSYTDAQEVINKLAKAEFDVKGIAIVGRDLTTVEVVTARLRYGRAAIAGVVNYSITRKRRDYAAASQLLAERYDIIISPDLTAKAHGVLGTSAAGMPGVHAAPHVPTPTGSPTAPEPEAPIDPDAQPKA